MRYVPASFIPDGHSSRDGTSMYETGRSRRDGRGSAEKSQGVLGWRRA